MAADPKSAGAGSRRGSGPRLCLASASPRRLALLQQAGVEPDILSPADMDETPLKGEAARTLAKRLSRDKAQIAVENMVRTGNRDGLFVLAADTVVTVGRRILPKTELLDEASSCLRLLSGRSHRVQTGVAIVTPKGTVRQRLVETRVRMKKLSTDEFDSYLASGEWRGKAGGYAIQGIAGSFVIKISGSYTNVVGLPLYETIQMLQGEGYPVHFNWLRGA